MTEDAIDKTATSGINESVDTATNPTDYQQNNRTEVKASTLPSKRRLHDDKTAAIARDEAYDEASRNQIADEEQETEMEGPEPPQEVMDRWFNASKTSNEATNLLGNAKPVLDSGANVRQPRPTIIEPRPTILAPRPTEIPNKSKG